MPKSTVEYWLACADEAHTAADVMPTPEARRLMLQIAASYQRLAQWVEQLDRDIGALRDFDGATHQTP